METFSLQFLGRLKILKWVLPCGELTKDVLKSSFYPSWTLQPD